MNCSEKVLQLNTLAEKRKFSPQKIESGKTAQFSQLNKKCWQYLPKIVTKFAKYLPNTGRVTAP